ncbi:ABC transporter permease [Agarivorans sp. MS3-6]
MATVLKRSRLAVWKDVIFAIFLREIRGRFNDKLGVSWAVLEPVLFILMLSIIRGRLNGGETHTIPTFAFMAYGMTLIQLFLSTMTACSNSISKNKSLYAFRQVQPISSVVAAALFELIVKIFVVLLLFVMMFLLHIDITFHDPLSSLVVFLSLWLFSASLGLIFGIARCFVKEVSKVEGVMTRPLFFISGVFFSLQDMPKDYWKYFDWNPILHAIELTRQAAYPSFGAVGVSFGFLLTVTITTVFLALSIYSVYWKKAISR